MIPLIWISTIVWILLLVISLVRISKRKLHDAGWLRANLLVLIVYSITVALAAQTAGNALWFAIFGEPYPGENLESLKFASLLGALAIISVTLVAFWDSLRSVGKNSERVPTAEKEVDTQDRSLPRLTQAPPPQVQIVLGMDELQKILERIASDRKKLESLKTKSDGELDHVANEFNQICASIDQLRSKYDPSWDSGLRGKIIVIYDNLRNSGSAIARRDYTQAQDHFDATYQVAMGLKQYLESSGAEVGKHRAPNEPRSVDIDPVAIARSAVVQRLPNATIEKWYDETVVEEDAYIEVRGIGIDQTRSSHPFRVRMTKQGRIVQDGTYVR